MISMEKLQWDTNFWGIDIIHTDTSDKIDFSKVENNSYLIQALSDVSNTDFIKYLELNGFHFIESKVTLQKQRYLVNAIEDTNFRDLIIDDLGVYQDIFFELFGMNSRYNMFPNKKVNEFYYTWMVNSIKGAMDDKCIGYFLAGKLAGFVTYRVRDGVLTIGLLGVIPEFQGKGISQKLLNYIDNVALNNNISNIKIATQGKNLRALNAYIKNGYNICSIDHWYYLIKGVNLNDSI